MLSYEGRSKEVVHVFRRVDLRRLLADLAVALAGVLSKATLHGKEARIVVNVGCLHSEKL